MKLIGPKFVRKANLWVVTIQNYGKQSEEWFDTRELALAFIKEKEAK